MTDVLTPAPPASLKACCADLWSHPGVRLLCGESLRPGGTDLTARALDLIGLEEGARVLDLGSGAGATLALLTGRGLRPVGADYSAALAAESGAVAPSVVADAERPPFRSGSMEAVLMECVLSAVPDKPAVLGEVVRMLRPGGRFLLSDVVVEGALPPPLDSLAGWIACAAGALPADGYTALLEESGLWVEAREDHRAALSAMLAQVTRRLALIAGAVRAGLLDTGPVLEGKGLIGVGERLLGVAKEAVDAGLLGYALFVGRARH
jgi:arsenite methyltransferase